MKKKERSLKEIKSLMELGLEPTYCQITHRTLTASESEDREWFGRNTDVAMRDLREETGDTL